MAQEIQRDALGSKDRAGRPLDAGGDGAGGKRAAVAQLGAEDNARVGLAEGAFGDGKAGKDAGLARDDDGAGNRVGGNGGGRGDVAGAAEVLGEGGANRVDDEVLRERRQVAHAGDRASTRAPTRSASARVMKVRWRQAGSAAGKSTR